MDVITEPAPDPTPRPPTPPPTGGGVVQPDRRHRGAGDADTADTAADVAVSVDGLTKRYGRRTVVDHLSFSLPTGTVTGLIGPNGAGKTTLMAMLLGLVRPSDGTGTILGHPLDQPAAYLPRTGALIEAPAFHPGASGTDNLRSLAVLGRHDERAISELIELVGLAGRADDRFGSYSLGMKQRLGIAAALLGDPALVILDEPTNGLDPSGMQDMRRLITDIAAHGRTVVVSSHLLGELEHVCDWLLVIDQGGLVHNGRPDELATAPDQLVLDVLDPTLVDDLAAIVGSTALPLRRDGARLVVTLAGVTDGPRLAADVNRRAHAAGIALSELHIAKANLEARYLDLIGADR